MTAKVARLPLHLTLADAKIRQNPQGFKFLLE